MAKKPVQANKRPTRQTAAREDIERQEGEEHQDDEPTGPAEREEDVVRFAPGDRPTTGEGDDRRGTRRTEQRVEDGDDLVDVKVGNKTVQMSRDAADAFRTQQEDYEDQLASSRRRGRDDEEEPQRRREEPDFLSSLGIEGKIEEQMLINPQAILEKVYKKAVKDATSSLSQSYTRDQQFRDFMSDFYDDNPDLRELKDVVQLVLGQNSNLLAKMNPGRARRELASLTKEHIDRIVRKARPEDEDIHEENEDERGETRRERPATTRTARPSGERQPRQEPRSENRGAPEQETGGSITDFLRKRRRARMAKRVATR